MQVGSRNQELGPSPAASQAQELETAMEVQPTQTTCSTMGCGHPKQPRRLIYHNTHQHPRGYNYQLTAPINDRSALGAIKAIAGSLS